MHILKSLEKRGNFLMQMRKSEISQQSDRNKSNTAIMTYNKNDLST